MSFANLGLNQLLNRSISDQGYEKPTPIQEKAIPEILSGRDVLAAAQTGTGKTASFTLPMLDL
ncbi:MAG: DEAD/DEAH box helicase, partial [Betaproteobacteria bacterium]